MLVQRGRRQEGGLHHLKIWSQSDVCSFQDKNEIVQQKSWPSGDVPFPCVQLEVSGSLLDCPKACIGDGLIACQIMTQGGGEMMTINVECRKAMTKMLLVFCCLKTRRSNKKKLVCSDEIEEINQRRHHSRLLNDAGAKL